MGEEEKGGSGPFKKARINEDKDAKEIEKAPRKYERRLRRRSVKPPASYSAPPTVGPTIMPMPKKVSRMANMVATFSGNSLAIMLKEPVRNPLFPQASIILKSKLSRKEARWLDQFLILP